MWQAVYPELSAQGLEFIAVAFDTAGRAAVAASIRATNIAERPPMLARLMGWSPELWAKQAPPTYLCLIDEKHVVAELYGMVNVPQGVWIDERGQLVRPPESAGTVDMVRHMNRETFEIPDSAANYGQAHRMGYIDALRDWAKNGAKSRFVMSPAEVRKRLRGPSADEERAATHVHLGQHLYRQGRLDAAKKHFKRASELHPKSWNYRRQSMMLDPELVGGLNTAPEFWAAVDALGEEQYYPPAELGVVA